MFTGLLHLHSTLRYILLILLILSILKSLSGWMGKKVYSSGDRKLSLFTMIAAHLQLIVGIILYFISPIVKAGLANMGEAMKDTMLRYWVVEHISLMIIAIILITLGNSLAKRATDDTGKHKRIAIFFLIALAVIFIAIPWPWSAVARGWMPGSN